MKILDNFLAEEDFKPIQSYFFKQLSWKYIDKIVGYNAANEDKNENEDCYQFVHTFKCANDPYLQYSPSEHSHILKPFFIKLAPWIVLRAKANLRPISPIHIHSAFHTDLGHIGNKTAIFYLNTCNGYTLFKDSTKVLSVENRLIIFDGSTLHCGASCTDQKARIVLNVNYIPGQIADNTPYIPDESVCGLPTLVNF